jgi:peptidoglycan hydrolase-like protein with peptidoglycan-binding domain
VPRKSRSKAAAEPAEDRRWFVLQAFGWSYKDAFAFSIAAGATVAIVVNGLWFQTGRHPAPMFKGSLAGAPPVTKDTPTAALQPPRPAQQQVAAKSDTRSDTRSETRHDGKSDKVEPAVPARAAAEIVSDIQRELVRRGFYDGVVDGRYGRRTEVAVRDLTQAAGIKLSSEPTEALLAAIKRSNAMKSAKAATGTTGAAPPRPPQPVRPDPIADVLAPSKRVMAVQRALSEYGYGQLKPNGVLDAETRAAVEKFERERKLPVTGQVSDRVTRELAAITGRPLD